MLLYVFVYVRCGCFWCLCVLCVSLFKCVCVSFAMCCESSYALFVFVMCVVFVCMFAFWGLMCVMCIRCDLLCVIV